MSLKEISDEIKSQIDRITLYNDPMSNAQMVIYLTNIKKDIDDIEDNWHKNDGSECVGLTEYDDVNDALKSSEIEITNLKEKISELKSLLDEIPT